MNTIGIIDDDEDSILLLSTLLEDKYNVVTFVESEKALDYFQTDPPDLILLDISMPGMSGVDVLKKMKQSPELQGVPVVALTGYTLPEDRKKFLDKGFDEYLPKPLPEENELFELIKKTMNRLRRG